ncbi:MAG: hypothetical protein ABEJ73_03105 [Haloplanus sp.]
MQRTTRATLVGIVGFLGAVVLFALTIYPFQYGVVESLVLAGAFVLVVLFETVLDDTSF